jgi:hypothetical protein
MDHNCHHSVCDATCGSYMMSKPRSIGTIAPHVNLRMRDSHDVYEAQERAIHTFPPYAIPTCLRTHARPNP